MDQEIENFLKAFKELENYLESLDDSTEGFTSFSRGLERAHYVKKNPLLANNGVYSFLKTAGELRNLLSHEDDICIPSPDFVSKFSSLKEQIIHPITAYQIATKADKIVYATPSSSLYDIVCLMAEEHISHVPVIVHNQVQAVFSSTTFFQFYYEFKTIKADKDFTIADFINVSGLDTHLNETYQFVPRNISAYSLLRNFSKAKSGDKRLSCLFVTEHGKKDEALLGVISQADLLRIPLLEREMVK